MNVCHQLVGRNDQTPRGSSDHHLHKAEIIHSYHRLLHQNGTKLLVTDNKKLWLRDVQRILGELTNRSQQCVNLMEDIVSINFAQESCVKQREKGHTQLSIIVCSAVVNRGVQFGFVTV